MGMFGDGVGHVSSGDCSRAGLPNGAGEDGFDLGILREGGGVHSRGECSHVRRASCEYHSSIGNGRRSYKYAFPKWQSQCSVQWVFVLAIGIFASQRFHVTLATRRIFGARS